MTLGQTQKGHEVAIAYGGRDLTPVERNYSATEHEALTVLPMPFKWLMTVKDPTGRLAKWSLLLQQFDFTIHHRHRHRPVLSLPRQLRLRLALL